MSKSIIVGLTGGIGSGKSLVANILKSIGIPVYDSDKAAKELYFKNSKLLDQLVLEFGESLLDSEGNFIPAALASIVFKDKEKLKRLNELVHPAVKLDFEEWLEANPKPIVFKEAAILLESGAFKSCDKIWLITAPQELKIKRAMSRDGSAREQVEARMSRQWTDKQKTPFADHLILNDEERMLIPQIMKGLEALKQELNSTTKA